jgi:hypothetical protein
MILGILDFSTFSSQKLYREAFTDQPLLIERGTYKLSFDRFLVMEEDPVGWGQGADNIA